MPTIKINNTEFEFNNIYYIDPNGNDTTGDGSKSTPWATLSKANSVVNDGDAIFVKGEHTLDTITFIKDISIIGNYLGYGSTLKPLSRGLKTTVNKTQKFYGLMLHQTSGGFEMFDGYQGTGTYKGHIELYNCILRSDGNNSDRPEHIYLQSFLVVNCIRIVGNTSVNKNYAANATYINTADNSNFVISVTNSSKTACLENATWDEDYNITSSGWENTGTGINPDNSQAHIGVYGGEFAWGWWGGALNIADVYPVFAWHKNIDQVNININIKLKEDQTDFRYKVLVNNIKILPEDPDDFILANNNPKTLSVQVPIAAFTQYENLLIIEIVDEDGMFLTSYPAMIYKENDEIPTFNRKLLYPSNYDIINYNPLDMEIKNGFRFKQGKTGSIVICSNSYSQVNTTGRKTISSIDIQDYFSDESLDIQIENDLSRGQKTPDGRIWSYTLKDIEKNNTSYLRVAIKGLGGF